MVETDVPLPNVLDDAILQAVNNATAAQNLRFQCVSWIHSGNLKFEINLQTSADEDGALHFEITMALDILSIRVTNIYANSRRSEFIVHDVLVSIGINNWAQLSNTITDKIHLATGISLAQPPRWFIRPKVLQERGR